MRHRLSARRPPEARRAGDVPVLVLPPAVAVPPGGQLLLGRSRAAAIRFADPTVSRRHAVLHRLDDGGWLLTDLASTHGTRLNGRPVRTGATVTDGDRLQLGRDTVVVLRT
jgi:pSer/pThr/pTyr-binding forkhead associated (FHA) protein